MTHHVSRQTELFLVSCAPETPEEDPDAAFVENIFDIEVEVWTDESMSEPATFDQLFVDAGMPHHRHGMNVVPEIESLSPGRWIARGMLLHMPGRWQFYVDVLEDGRIERAQWSTWLSLAPTLNRKRV